MSKFDKNLISILEKIYALEYICQNGITKALQDVYGKREVIFSLLGALHNELIEKIGTKDTKNQIMGKFDALDIKGLKGLRNFIAHDYEGVNLSIIEDTLRYDIGKLKKIIENNFPNTVPLAQEKFKQNLHSKPSASKD